MANKNIDVLIECPFYSKEVGLSLVCEGIIPKTCLVTKFSCITAKQKHMRSNCYYKNGGDCFLAKSLYEKYDAEDIREHENKKAALKKAAKK